MKQGIEKNEILNERPLDFFKKAMSGYSYLKETGFLNDFSLENLIAEDLVEGEEQMKNGLKEDSIESFKRAINRMEIMAENKGIEIDYSNMLYNMSEEEKSSFDNLESEQFQDRMEAEKAPEPEIKISEPEKNKEKIAETEKDLFSIFENLEKRLGALNVDATKKQEIQTYLDAASDAILENSEEDANAFLAMAEVEINKFSVVREEIAKEIEDTYEEEEDFDGQGASLLSSESLEEEGTPEEEKSEESEIEIDKIEEDKEKEEESLKYKEYITDIDFVNSKFLNFFDQEKDISSEEKEKVALLLECAYDAMKEAEEAEDEEEKIKRYEEALEDANMASERMDKVLKESSEKEIGKTRFAQIVRLSEIQKAERKKYFIKKNEEDRIKIPKKRDKFEDILKRAGILTTEDEDKFRHREVVMSSEIKESIKEIEENEKKAEYVYKRIIENESFYSISNDDFEELKRLAVQINVLGNKIISLKNKEEEEEWENMASNKKIAEEIPPFVDIKKTGENLLFSEKDTKYLEKGKESKLPNAFKRFFDFKKEEKSPLNGSAVLFKKDKSKNKKNNIIITDENAKSFE